MDTELEHEYIEPELRGQVEQLLNEGKTPGEILRAVVIKPVILCESIYYYLHCAWRLRNKMRKELNQAQSLDQVTKSFLHQNIMDGLTDENKSLVLQWHKHLFMVFRADYQRIMAEVMADKLVEVEKTKNTVIKFNSENLQKAMERRRDAEKVG